jgi:hypothetical protein
MIATLSEAFVHHVGVDRRSSACRAPNSAPTIFTWCPSVPSLHSRGCGLAMNPRGKDDSSSDEPPQQQGGGFFQAVGSFFEELDAFMDDAS